VPAIPTETSSGRPWRDRWELIESWIPETPGVALDFGAAEGHFAFALAERGWTVHAVEARNPWPESHLQHERIVWHYLDLDARGLLTFGLRLGRPASFDLALGLSVLHWMEDWGAAYWALRASANRVILEVPHPEEHRDDPEKVRRFRWLHHLTTTNGIVLKQSTHGWESDHRRTLSVQTGAWSDGETAMVHAGRGAAAGLLPGGLERWLGYDPYPGTLDHHVVHDLGYPAPSAVVDGWSFWPVRYMGLPAHVAGHPGWEPGGRAIDLVGPVCFRQVFGLRDGDYGLIEFPHG
jgi:hypothetical protein